MKQYKTLIKKNFGSIAGVALLNILMSFAMVFAVSFEVLLELSVLPEL